jgi:hypothetical protein
MKIEIVCAITFLFGSLLFSWDGALYVSECGEAVDKSCEWHSRLYLAGSVLFTLGSAIWLGGAMGGNGE